MEQKVNYQKKLEEILKKEEGRRPRLLLQCCCAPCSSYVLEYLSQFFEIDLFFYNPNIDTAAEFELRRRELWRLADEMGLKVGRIAPEYRPEEFLEKFKTTPISIDDPDIILPKDQTPKIDKYDPMVPDHLLRFAFLHNQMDIPEAIDIINNLALDN